MHEPTQPSNSLYSRQVAGETVHNRRDSGAKTGRQSSRTFESPRVSFFHEPVSTPPPHHVLGPMVQVWMECPSESHLSNARRCSSHEADALMSESTRQSVYEGEQTQSLASRGPRQHCTGSTVQAVCLGLLRRWACHELWAHWCLF